MRIALKLLIISIFIASLVCTAVIRIGRNEAEKYDVKGVDVSSYQGKIDWNVLADEGISFAFIKATEGSRYVDRYFAENIKGARAAHLRAGAYHFLSYDSSGLEQAENFIATVPDYPEMLPPVVDVEFYGDYEKNPLDEEATDKILSELIDELTKHYGKSPIIYTTRRAYSLYISGKYEDCDIWISDIIKKPTLPDGRKWTFWQYSHTEKLPGYEGVEEHIDMNVYNGDYESFLKYGT